MKPAFVPLSFRLILPAAFAMIVAVAAGAQPKPAPVLLAKYNFEDIPAFVPNWGAGLGSTYKSATGWKTPFKIQLDTDNPHAGANALRFDLLEPAKGEKILHSPSIAIPSSPDAVAMTGPSISVRVYVRTKGLVAGGAGIRILERNEKGASVRLLENKTSLIPVPETADWKELVAEGTLDKATRSISFMVVMYDQPSPATIWIDDVSLETESAPSRK